MLYQNHETIPSGTCDVPEWHHGRKDYRVWLIELGSGDV